MRNHFVTAALAAAFVLLAIKFAPALEARPATSEDCHQTITVFRDVSLFGRKDSAAENMTEDHARYNEEGWQFQDMEPYVENADLEGFFLTYSRSAPCAS